MEASPSQTAMLAAVVRGQHRLEDAPPWVLDDPFALVLVGPPWPEFSERLRSVFRPELVRQLRAGVVARTRYAEERLADGAFTQYVVLGAGLDSFAWRRPDLLRTIRVFEVDHPASQAWKRERATELALPLGGGPIFAPIDFEIESLRDGLDAAGFDWAQPTMFSWLGVTMYLTADAIETTLRTVAACAAGSEIVFSYWADESVQDHEGRALVEILVPMAAQMGEPVQEARSAKDVETLVTSCGLRVADHPTRDEIVTRFFAGRSDGLVPWSPEALVAATVG